MSANPVAEVSAETGSHTVAERVEQSAEDLAALLHHASQLAHSELPAAELVERAGSLILHTVCADSARIALRDAETGLTVEFAQQRQTRPAARQSFSFSRPITVRGVDFGHFELHVTRARWPIAVLVEAAETLLELLGRRAELDALRQRSAQLRDEAEQLNLRKQFAVAVTRAAGIIAARRNWTLERSRAWLAAEAAREGLSLFRYAERIVLANVARRRLATPRPGLPLRKSA
jgi:hypothetical protein